MASFQCVIYNNGTKIVMKIIDQPKLVESKVKRVIQILS